jgi:hypothetical protein
MHDARGELISTRRIIASTQLGCRLPLITAKSKRLALALFLPLSAGAPNSGEVSGTG